MAAIVTNDIRVHNALQFVEAVSETANTVLYTFVGQPWSIPASAAADNVVLSYDIWDNMIALKRIQNTDVKPGIRKIVWSTGNTYPRYTQNDANLYSRSFYVINPSDNGVYKCLANNRGQPSTVAPTVQTGITTGNTQLLSDGYRWKYMYTISSADLAKFGTPSFIPVVENTDSGSNVAHQGAILHIEVVNPGSGYSSAPNVVIQGDGVGANALCIMQSGTVANVTMTAIGNGYRFANVLVTGGGSPATPAVLQASIAPTGGHGYNNFNELGAVYAIVNTRLETTDVAFPAGITYHQVGLVQDPMLFGTNTISYASTLKNYKTLHLQSAYASAIYQGNITFTTTQANGYVLNKDSANNQIINFIQTRNAPGITSNLSLAYGKFTGGVTGYILGGSTFNIQSVANAEVKANSGRIIYVDNRAAITRQTNQAESISIILEF